MLNASLTRSLLRWPLAISVLSTAALAACDTAETAPQSTAVGVAYPKNGVRPPEMTLPTPALATIFTDAGTRIDFLEPAPGAGVFVTESGPAATQDVWAPLAKKHANDLLATFRALQPDGLIPQALIDAHERGKQRATTSRPRLHDDESPEFSPSRVKGPVGSSSAALIHQTEPGSAALIHGTEFGSGCSQSTVDVECNQGPDWFFCHKNATSDFWFQRVDNNAVFEKVCVATSQFVQWKVQVRPWWSWSTLGDFTVGGGSFRRVWNIDLAIDFDYHSNVFNVAPDIYHRGASGAR